MFYTRFENSLSSPEIGKKKPSTTFFFSLVIFYHESEN